MRRIIDQKPVGLDGVALKLESLFIKGDQNVRQLALREHGLVRGEDLNHGRAAFDFRRVGPECVDLMIGTGQGRCQKLAAADDPFAAFSADTNQYVFHKSLSLLTSPRRKSGPSALDTGAS